MRDVSPMATLHPPALPSMVQDKSVDQLSMHETAKLAALFCGAWVRV